MKVLLRAIRGARLIAKGKDGDRTVYHFLLPGGKRVLEIVI